MSLRSKCTFIYQIITCVNWFYIFARKNKKVMHFVENFFFDLEDLGFIIWYNERKKNVLFYWLKFIWISPNYVRLAWFVGSMRILTAKYRVLVVCVVITLNNRIKNKNLTLWWFLIVLGCPGVLIEVCPNSSPQLHIRISLVYRTTFFYFPFFLSLFFF